SFGHGFVSFRLYFPRPAARRLRVVDRGTGVAPPGGCPLSEPLRWRAGRNSPLRLSATQAWITLPRIGILTSPSSGSFVLTVRVPPNKPRFSRSGFSDRSTRNVPLGPLAGVIRTVTSGRSQAVDTIENWLRRLVTRTV